MLRGAGRIHRQHIKQAVLSFGKRHEIALSLHSPHHSIHISCSPRAATSSRALAVSSNYIRHIPEGGPTDYVCQGASNIYSTTTAPSPAASRGHRPWSPTESCEEYPSGVIDAVDAFALGTKEESKGVIQDIKSSPEIRKYFRPRETARRLAQSMASSSRPSRAQSVMALAHGLGCCFKPNHFESVVHQLAAKEHWAFIPPLVSLAKHQCGRTTARLLNWKMRAFIECQRFGRLNHVLEEFARDSVQPIRRTFHLLVSGHIRNRDLNSAKRGLEMMEEAGFPVDASTHALIVTVHRSLGLDPQVHARAFESMRSVDARTSTRVLNSIIQQLLDIGDERSAADYIKHFGHVSDEGEAVEGPGDIITGVDGVPSSHLHTATHRSDTPLVAPDTVTFTILINYLASQGHLSRVRKVLDRMLEANVEPDSGIAAALIRAHCLCGRDDMAASLLGAMLHSDAAARDFAACLRVKWVPNLPINVKGIVLTVHVFNAILGRVMEIRGLSGARFIFRIMRHTGIQPNATTTEVFLNYLDRTENVKPRQLIRTLRNMSPGAHGPTIRHLHIILRNVLRREKHLVHRSGWDATASKFSSTRNFNPTFPGDRILLSTENFDPGGGLKLPRHVRQNSWLRPIFLSLSRKAVRSDRATIGMRLRHEAIIEPNLESVKSVFRYMLEQGMHPNRYHYISVMYGYAMAGNMRGAEQIMRSAKEAGFEPEVVMYTVLISGYGRKGRPALAMRTFRAMVSAGIAPDVPAIDALAHAYFAVGAYTVARKVLLQLWPQVKPFPSELQSASLKRLAEAFRVDPERSRAVRDGPLTKLEQRLLHWKLRGLLQEWKHVQRLQIPSLLSRQSRRCRTLGS
ncbi:hypothetical protein HYDPIDRAFT_124718 [Hydnomerulius pinastri MD-312]|nr:hypothetical protein HYDPIDRAFT_124718 [Hydnomerulius pinastri MD-312]